jgi:hypothetical protein
MMVAKVTANRSAPASANRDAELAEAFLQHWRDRVADHPVTLTALAEIQARDTSLLNGFQPESAELDAAWRGLAAWKKKKVIADTEARLRSQLQEDTAQTQVTQLLAALAADGCEASAEPGSGDLFRNAGNGQHPWQIAATGFQHRAGVPDGAAVLAHLRAIYTAAEGADVVLEGYRRSNDNSLSVPFISAAPGAGHNAGKDVIWEYAIAVTLTEVSAETIKAELGVGDGHLRLATVSRLMTDSGGIAGAQVVAFLGGGADEHTFVTKIPNSSVTAFRRIHGAPWMTRWRALAHAEAFHARLEEFGQLAAIGVR